MTEGTPVVIDEMAQLGRGGGGVLLSLTRWCSLPVEAVLVRLQAPQQRTPVVLHCQSPAARCSAAPVQPRYSSAEGIASDAILVAVAGVFSPKNSLVGRGDTS